MYCLFTKKGYSLLSGYKTITDKKIGIEILPEGTHGTANWISDYARIKTMRGMNNNILVYGAPATGV